MGTLHNSSASAHRDESADKCQFASDNYAGICPEALQAMIAANQGCAHSYGEDEWTRRACEMLRERFETDCEVFFVFNGTAANALAVATLCKPFHSVICHETAHLETDECGAPEFFSSGSKVLLASGEQGKVDLAEVERLVRQRTDIHYPKPHALSITQATELGTVYSVEEIRQVGLLAKALHLRLHMDGARLANAVATLDVPLKELTWKAGVDVVCLGGAKNGGLLGEAVIFFDRGLAKEFDLRCKQVGQLASKMRFLSAQWIGMLENDAWLNHARHANRCAHLLAEQLQGVSDVKILFPQQANSVFLDMPAPLLDALRRQGWHFYTFIGGGARFMCSWNTTETDVAALVSDIRRCAARTGSQGGSKGTVGGD